MRFSPYNKFGNIRMVIDNHTFASKREGARYTELKLLERAGKIHNLALQPRFELQRTFIDGHTGEKYRSIVYVADFSYIDEVGHAVVEDVKGAKTDIYLLKKKLFLFRYPDYFFREI